jgi:hypothetical protein
MLTPLIDSSQGNRGEYSLHVFWPDYHVVNGEEDGDAPNWTYQYSTQKMAEVAQMDNCNPT